MILFRPSDAVVTHFNVQDNDLIIWGTDGLFDNMHPQDIFDVFQQNLLKEVSFKISDLGERPHYNI